MLLLWCCILFGVDDWFFKMGSADLIFSPFSGCQLTINDVFLKIIHLEYVVRSGAFRIASQNAGITTKDFSCQSRRTQQFTVKVRQCD